MEKNRSIILFLITLFAAAALIVSCGGSPSQEEDLPGGGELTGAYLDQIELLDHDVNYSQCWKHQISFESGGVETLLLVRNLGDHAIDEYGFSLATKADGTVDNLRDPGDPFVAKGYIAPHSTGYMLARIHIPEDTDHDQGTITGTAARTCSVKKSSKPPKIRDVRWYDLVYQEVLYSDDDSLHDKTEWNVDFSLTNRGDEVLPAKKTMILAAPDLKKAGSGKGTPVFGRWACGTLKKKVAPGQKLEIRKGLDLPQLDIEEEGLSQRDLKLYVIEADLTDAASRARKPAPSPGAKAMVSKAKELAWPYGTDKDVYRYHGGRPTKAYRKALDAAYPDRSRWGRQPRKGASCDVFAGTVARTSGYDADFPRGLDEVEEHMKNHPALWKKCPDITVHSEMVPGDVVYQRWTTNGNRYGHIMIYLGHGKVANAHYGGGGKYAVIESAKKQLRSNRSDLKLYVYRPLR